MVRAGSTGHTKLLPEALAVIVSTSFRSSEGPFFKVRVTGPSASSQVILKVDPASMPSKLLLVR